MGQRNSSLSCGFVGPVVRVVSTVRVKDRINRTCAKMTQFSVGSVDSRIACFTLEAEGAGVTVREEWVACHVQIRVRSHITMPRN
jgi:hypothetical protein